MIGTQNLKDILDNLIFVDIEQPNSDQRFICQIATIQYGPTTDKNIEIGDFINPYVKFDHFNKKQHGINERKIFDKPNFKQAFLDKIDIQNERYIWVGHNIENDLKVIKRDVYRYNKEISKFKYICTQELFEKEFGRKQGNSLKKLYKELFDIELENNHNAYCDALACKNLFEFITKEYKMKNAIESYIHTIPSLLFLEDIKSDPYISELDILKIAISIDVCTELKLNSMDVESKLNDLKYEFDYLMILSQTEFSKCNDYEEFIKNTIYNKKTINMIYLQILLSHFTWKDIINQEEINYILKWIDSLDENLKSIYPFDIFAKRIYATSKNKKFTNEQANEIILLLNKNELRIDKRPNYDAIKSSDGLNVEKIDGFNFGEINDKNKIFDELINNHDLSGKTFCLTGEFKLMSEEKISKNLETKFNMIKKNKWNKSENNIDILIVGSLGNDKWISEKYGKKIKKAIRNNIKIISEEKLNKYIIDIRKT